jgi:hypothetical protein
LQPGKFVSILSLALDNDGKVVQNYLSRKSDSEYAYFIVLLMVNLTADIIIISITFVETILSPAAKFQVENSIKLLVTYQKKKKKSK